VNKRAVRTPRSCLKDPVRRIGRMSTSAALPPAQLSLSVWQGGPNEEQGVPCRQFLSASRLT
jgi:hypothetical protein